MGKGAYLSIANMTDESLSVDYTNIVRMYQHGEEGSDFRPISGPLDPHGGLPYNTHPQYIEATRQGLVRGFHMVLQGPWGPVTIEFTESVGEWRCITPLVKLKTGSMQFTTVVVPDGDQFQMMVTVQYTVDPAGWMGLVKDDILDTKLCLLPIPGSHDSASYPAIALGSQTQSRDIKGQLEAGFRYFDFRVKVKNGVYYGVHGGSPTDHDYTAVDGTSGNKPYLFDVIKEFLATHTDEVVILHFSHFAAFSDTKTLNDALRFAECIERDFGALLVPRAATANVTYGACVNNGQRVIAMVNDMGDDAWLAEAWYADPAKKQDAKFWVSSSSWLDRYSAYRAGPGVDLSAAAQKTLQNQEEYLKPPQPGQSGHRDLDKLWVSQPILNCDAVPFGDHSWNYWAAQAINALTALVYEYSWYKGHSYNWNNQGTYPIRPPNIVIFDFAGDFDGFPEACVRMLKK